MPRPESQRSRAREQVPSSTAAAAPGMVPPVCGRFSRARLESPAGSHETGSTQRKCSSTTVTNPAVACPVTHKTDRIISEATLQIGGYVNQALVQFITGDLDIETQWEEYLTTLEKMNVQQYIDTYQKYYDAYMANAAK